MPDQEFKIAITGDAASAVGAAQQTGDSLKKLKVDTTGLSDETKKSLGILSETNDSTKAFGRAAEETGEKVEKLSRREIRELGNELGRATGLGSIGRAALGGIALAAFAAGAAIEFLKGAWAEMKEAVNGNIEINVKTDDAAKIQSVAEAYASLAAALRKTREAQSSPQTAAARDISDLQTKLKLIQEILQAEKTEQLANLEAQKDHMSPQAFEAARQRIEASFAGKESSAGFDEKQAEIERKQQELAELESRAAQEKAAGEDTAKRGGVIATAKEQAEAAKEQLKKIDEQLEMVKGLHDQATGRQSLPKYEGVEGKYQEASDLLSFDKMAGRDGTYKSVIAGLELQRAQAQSALVLGVQAASQEKAGTESISKSAADQADADKLREQVKQLQADLDAERQNKLVTTALTSAGTAITQEHAAEGNNTAQGYKDAQAAHAAAQDAVNALRQALTGVTDTHSEAYKAIMAAFANLQAEDKRLAAMMDNSHLAHQ